MSTPTFFSIVRAATLSLFLVCLVPLAAHASNHDTSDAGWYQYRAAALSRDTSCGPGRARLSFVLKEYGSMRNLGDVTGLSLNVKVTSDEGAVVRETGYVPVSGAVTNVSVCYNPLTEFVFPTILATEQSPYRSYRGRAWRPKEVEDQRNEIGYHLQANIHVMRKTNGSHTVEAVHPVRQIFRGNPQYRFSIPSVTNLYGATAIDSTLLRVVDMSTQTLLHRLDIDTPGGAGTFTLPSIQLADGYYTWAFTNRTNGTLAIALPESYLTLRMLKSPTTGAPAPIPFLIDRAAPAARATHTVGAATESRVAVTFAATVRDPLAGMATVRYSLENITPGLTRTVSTYTYSFTVGAGINGGPKAERVVTVPFNLMPGSTYRYTVVATDAAGNRTTTPAVTFTTPGTLPEVVEPPVVDPVDIEIDLSVSPGVVRRGDEVTITWTATPAGSITGCTLEGVGTEPISVDPSASEDGISVPVTSMRTFTLRCTGIDGSVHEDTGIVQMLPEVYER